MTNLQLFLAILGVISGEIGVVLLFMFRGFGSVEGRFTLVEARLGRIEADLRQFYHDLGRHEEAVTTLKERLK